jgi:hypothetical protein
VPLAVHLMARMALFAAVQTDTIGLAKFKENIFNININGFCSVSILTSTYALSLTYFKGHCLSTITPPAYGGYDIEDPLTSEGTDRFVSTEGCFSCKVIHNEKTN